MIKTGKMNKLKVVQIKGKKCFLDGEEHGNIFIRSSELPEGTLAGSAVDVFLYSSNDGLAATTKKPYAQLGEFGYLEVVSVSEFGAFLDWGIGQGPLSPEKVLQHICRRNMEREGKNIRPAAKRGQASDLCN